MNLSKVLENWADYEKKKTELGSEVNLFLCKEKWETDYLHNKIKEHFPFINDYHIIGAIQITCDKRIDPVTREEFVKAVMKKLQLVY